MMYSDLPEYKLSYRNLMGGNTAPVRPHTPQVPVSGAVSNPTWLAPPNQSGGISGALLNAAPSIMNAASRAGRPDTSGVMCIQPGCTDVLHGHTGNQTSDWMDAIGALAKGAGASGGPISQRVGNLGSAAASMISSDQQKAQRGRELAAILNRYSDNPEMRRDALMAYIASQGQTPSRGY